MPRNVLVNVLNAAASILLAAISVPLALHYVGIDGFGVWTLAQTALVYVATAETGFGPAVQRYVSVARGANELKKATKVVWTAAAFYLALGAVAATVTVLLAPTIVELFDVPEPLRADAVVMFRITGAVMVLALLAGGLANVLQGMERFVGAALSTAVTSIVFLIAAAILLERGMGLRGLALAALAQQAVGVVMRVVIVRDVLTAARPSWVSRAQGRELLGFSLRLQVNVISTLVNSQTDKLVVGLLANTAVLGAVGIASQAAEAVRFVIGAALSPVMARLAVVHGSKDETALGALFRALEGAWMQISVGVTAIATALMPALIIAWVGDEYGGAPKFAVILTFGYCVSMFCGPALAYLRAIGRINPEMRLGLGLIIANIVLSIALGIAFGATGVVTATALAYVGGTAVFLNRVRPMLPANHAPLHLPRVIALALLAAAAAGGWGLLMAYGVPRGIALVPLGIGGGLVFVAFAHFATGGLGALGFSLPRRRPA